MIKQKHNYLTWVEIDLKALKHNFSEIKKLARKQFIKNSHPAKRKNEPDILAVIKADAYGHGMLQAANVLDRMGVSCFGVSDVAEGITLRKNGIKKPVLIFESTLPVYARDIVEYNLTPTVCTMSFASALNNCAKTVDRVVDIHVMVDTGMGRLGIWHKDAKKFIERIMKFSNLSTKGIYTHFPIADANPAFTKKQVKQLYDLVSELDNDAAIVLFIHAANSMGLGGYKTHILNLSRPGLMLYGLYPSAKLKRKINLRPVMSVKSRIIFLKSVKKGRGISYGHTFVAPRKMTVATLPIGYNDGYLRCLSNKTHVIVGGKKCPVVGRVTMDQIMVDVSRVKSSKLGMEAVIIGEDRKVKVTADDLARQAETINYEIVCSLGNRLPRVFK